jgi:dTDP-4-dehydrorhamnose 3,5-epimerase
MPFQFKKLSIPEVILITPEVYEDDRGFFIETYKKSEFEKNGINIDFVQDNYVKSEKGVLRGLHYQLNPKAQGKLVRVTKGKVLDVVVDIRKNSPTYGKYVAVELSASNKQMLWIPPGFAHGYLVLEDDTEFQYKVTSEYSPEHDRGIIWDDPSIRIKWPIDNPILSDKDSKLPLLKDAENNFSYD